MAGTVPNRPPWPIHGRHIDAEFTGNFHHWTSFTKVLTFHKINWCLMRYSKIMLPQDEKHKCPTSLSLDGTNESLLFTALVSKGKLSWYLNKPGGEFYSIITLGFGWGSGLSTERYVYRYERSGELSGLSRQDKNWILKSWPKQAV